ncbi:MAG: FAD:protein FMN transferase [bacterium]
MSFLHIIIYLNPQGKIMRRFCLFVSMLVLAFIFGNSTVYLTNDAALKLAFPKNDKVIPKKVTFSAEQKKKICTLAKIDSSPGEFTYYTGVLKKKITGFAVIADTRSKLASFQFLLVVNLNGTIRSVEVMSYNEDIGSEITNKDFLVQYKNKSSNNKIKVKEDINNIAGATISCRNLTDSVRINLACLTVIAPIEKKAVPKPKKTASMSSYVIPLMTSVVKPYARARYLMGTLLELQVYADNSETANSAINAAFDETVRLEDIFSVYKPDSDASRVNTASNLPVKVSEDYIKLLSKCNEITQETNGAFDVTAAPLISIWKTAEIRNVMPTTEEIEKAKNSVGISKLIIDDNNKTVFSQTPGVKANFGGIAKGYALDKAAKILKEHGIKSALLILVVRC